MKVCYDKLEEVETLKDLYYKYGYSLGLKFMTQLKYLNIWKY